jgi:hypothetical protein
MAKSAVKKQKARPNVKKAKKQPPKPKVAKPEWATKEEIAQLVSKKAVAKLATREEIALLASKEDIAALPSREAWLQLDQKIGSLETRLETIDKKIELLANQVQEGDSSSGFNRINTELMQIREVVSNLELKTEETKAFEHSLLLHENRLNDLDTKIRNLEGTG